MSLTEVVLAAEPDYHFHAHPTWLLATCDDPAFSVAFDALPDRIIYTDTHNPKGFGFAARTIDGVLHIRIEPLMGESHYRPHGITWPTYDGLLAHRITAAANHLGLAITCE